MPSLALDLKEYKDLPEASRNNYVAAVAYQTAYVMGLLCASALRADEYPKRKLGSDGKSGAFAMQLIEILKREERTPQWLRVVESHPLNALNACTPFILDAALRRLVRRTEFGEAYALILESFKRGNRGVEAVCSGSGNAQQA